MGGRWQQKSAHRKLFIAPYFESNKDAREVLILKSSMFLSVSRQFVEGRDYIKMFMKRYLIFLIFQIFPPLSASFLSIGDEIEIIFVLLLLVNEAILKQAEQE